MALPRPMGLVPSEVAFLCEMELVTIVPRQRLDSIDLLSGPTPPLRPPHRANLPLWLALLLKKQRRANVVPPPWLHPAALADIVQHETKIDTEAFSPPPPPPRRSDGRTGAARAFDDADPAEEARLAAPFLPSCTADAPSAALPYHWYEMSELLLAHAGDDVPAAAEVRSLLKDLQEVRAAKMRSSVGQLQEGVGGVMSLRGVGAMELAESRGFILGVVEGVRKLGASAEAARREEDEAAAAAASEEESGDEMEL